MAAIFVTPGGSKERDQYLVARGNTLRFFFFFCFVFVFIIVFVVGFLFFLVPSSSSSLSSESSSLLFLLICFHCHLFFFVLIAFFFIAVFYFLFLLSISNKLNSRSKTTFSNRVCVGVLLSYVVVMSSMLVYQDGVSARPLSRFHF